MAYLPAPMQTDHITLTADIQELTEKLARNTHDVWAQQRMRDGWQHGQQRDDGLKKHPCLVPYEDLPEEEKEYDRQTALETLKAIMALGYRIVGPEEKDSP